VFGRDEDTGWLFIDELGLPAALIGDRYDILPVPWVTRRRPPA
jgi:hypothetical protein